jgi:hypothetical protein
MFVAPGHNVASATPGIQVYLPEVAAMKTAVCSLRVKTSSIDDFCSESNKSKFSSPGTQYTVFTHFFSRIFTIKSDVFIFIYQVLNI